MKLRVKIQYIGFIVILLMFFCGITNNMSVVHAEVYGDFEYSLINNGTEIEITKYKGVSKEIVIPDVIDGKDVTSIGVKAFYLSIIESIEIPEGVKNIGDNAFQYCFDLKKINFPVGMKSIGSDAFGGCGIINIEIPAGLEIIGARAFFRCGKLEGVVLPETLKVIDGSAFQECSNLTNVEILAEETNIGNHAFKDTGMEEITLPLNAASVEDGTKFCDIFGGIKDNGITPDIPETLKKVKITKATVIPVTYFMWCDNLTSIELPEGLVSIGRNAFACCQNLTDITIPESVTEIGGSAFYRCYKLTNIVIPAKMTTIAKTTFVDCENLSITIPVSVTEIATDAFNGLYKNVKVTIICEENSYAHNFAIENNKSYKLYCSPENHVYSTEWLSDETHHWKECIREECTACTARKDVAEHTWEMVIDKAATVEEEGSQHEECTECGYKKEAVSIPKVEAHKHVGVLVEAVAPGCETDGTIAYYMCDCGKYYAEASCETELTQEQLVIKATGHKWKTVIDKAATVEEEGSQHEECTVCGYKKEAVSIPKVEEVHKHVGVLVEAVAPICETDGNIAYYMCDCGKYYAEASCETELTQEQLVIKATGHKWKTVIDKAPTVEEEGSQHEECTECGYKKKAVSIPKVIEHVPDNTIVLVEKGKAFTDSNTNVIFKVTNPGTIVDGNVVGAQVEYTKPSDSAARVVIPETVTMDGITYRITSIAANAFKNDRKIAELLIGNNVITIGNNAFNGCKKLTKVTIGKGVRTIGTSAFSGCSRLKTVSMGANVTTIGAKAFYKCTALTKITIPAKVRKIGKQAFYGCKKLKRIVIKTTKLTKPKVGSKAFKGIHPKATIKVPKKKLPSYKKILKARGVGSKAKIKK
ncbi:MAG: leucine-rich repeat domain-containing protein [Lachnospira sp.]|nr:leucine-rich repeat domain-containing protein [Lachnospira sp.]